MARPVSDIKMIRVLTKVLSNGWVVELEYKDGKAATWTIDRAGLPEDKLLHEVMLTIRRQLESNQSKYKEAESNVQ